MKKMICLFGIGLLFVSVVFVGCASLQFQKTAITKSNLSTLKGTWSGWTTFSSFSSNPVLTTMEIDNDTVPVKAKITLQNLPSGVAAQFPADAMTAGNSAAIIEFTNAHVSDQGTLIGTTGQNFLELTLLVGEKTKMSGWFYYYGGKGTVTLTKK
jgi:hypothetical protein